MDPRHPELALSRLKELIKQYDEIEYRISHATTSAGISQAEREGGLVVQEMCLVAPRIHEAMMQTSRNRRHDLTHGVVVDMSKYEVPAGATGEEEGVVVGPTDQIIAVNEPTTEEAEVVEKPVEKIPEIASEGVLEVIEVAKKNTEAEKKTAKKTTRKKKTTKKADK